MYNPKSKIQNKILEPIFSTSKTYYLVFGTFFILSIIGLYEWTIQLKKGLGVTGMNNDVFWGIYISNFVFFIGISYAGTLISAILRITGADWRVPLTRIAESITVVGIVVGVSMVLFDMGHPERLFLVPLKSRLQSPLFWDMLTLSTYLVGSLLFLYLPLIPDFAILRDNLAEKSGFKIRKFLYNTLALKWHGTESQLKYLERSLTFISVILIPIAVMTHTVIALIFAVTWRPGWHSTIFGPYFVIAAIYSGVGALIVAMAIIRKGYHFEQYITHRHFRNMGYVLLTLDVTYIYFTASDIITSAYHGGGLDIELLKMLFIGQYAPLFWGWFILGMIVPGLLIIYSAIRYENKNAIRLATLASILVVIGMWVKRFIIIVPTLIVSSNNPVIAVYHPTITEWLITMSGTMVFICAFALFAKVIPLISVWEVEEREELRKFVKSKVITTTKETIKPEITERIVDTEVQD